MENKRYGRLGLVWFSCLNEIWKYGYGTRAQGTLGSGEGCQMYTFFDLPAMKDNRYGRLGLVWFSCQNEIWKYGYGTKAYK